MAVGGAVCGGGGGGEGAAGAVTVVEGMWMGVRRQARAPTHQLSGAFRAIAGSMCTVSQYSTCCDCSNGLSFLLAPPGDAQTPHAALLPQWPACLQVGAWHAR